MKILISGASSFVGKNLAIKLKNQGYNAVSLLRSEKKSDFFIKNDLKYQVFHNDEDLINIFKKEKFDTVIHLATLYLINNELKDIDNLIDSNIKFGTKILQISSDTGVKNFINTSSFIQNYENKNYSPVNLYAATKQAFEDIGKYYGESGKINFTSISLVNSYGPNDERKKIFNIWKDTTITGETIKSTSGEQFIDILHINDVTEAFLKLIEYIKLGNNINLKKYAISSNELKKLKDLHKIFENVVGTTINVEWGALPHREREVMYPYNIGEKVPNWTPQITLKEGIKLFLNNR